MTIYRKRQTSHPSLFVLLRVASFAFVSAKRNNLAQSLHTFAAAGQTCSEWLQKQSLLPLFYLLTLRSSVMIVQRLWTKELTGSMWTLCTVPPSIPSSLSPGHCARSRSFLITDLGEITQNLLTTQCAGMAILCQTSPLERQSSPRSERTLTSRRKGMAGGHLTAT